MNKKTLEAFVALAIVIFLCRQFTFTRRIEERLFVLERIVDGAMEELAELDKVVVSPDTFQQEERPMQTNPRKIPVARTEKKRESFTIAQDSPKLAHSATSSGPNGSRKFANPIMLELNIVDSVTLVRVPGIGATSASLILSYREQLGGFYSPRQIGEKLKWDAAQERLDEWSGLWFKTEPKLIRRTNVNTADFRELLRHPYLEYNQVKALVNYRQKHSRISGFEVLSMLEEFSEEDILRLEYYLEF